MSSENNQQKNKNTIINIMLAIAGILILFSFFAPYLFTSYSLMDLSNYGQIGDTVGGIMNPFIAISGVVLTYLAFYIQYRANKQQREQFNQQLEIEKSNFRDEIQEQQKQFRKTQFENQFYEMIKLHKENLNEISISYIRGFQAEEEVVTINSREVFKHYTEEIQVIYYVVKKNFNKENPQDLFKIAYELFFDGINSLNIRTKSKENPNYEKAINLIHDINNSRLSWVGYSNVVSHLTNYELRLYIPYDIASGQSSNLAHFYRHLYQMVKFVVKQNENDVTYEEKRNYLRFLRAQLSNQEQAMLFYNWQAGHGKNWQDSSKPKGNRFFTDYRMIHNIHPDIIIKDFDLTKIFDLEKTIRKEKHRMNDSLFEFQDWN